MHAILYHTWNWDGEAGCPSSCTPARSLHGTASAVEHRRRLEDGKVIPSIDTLLRRHEHLELGALHVLHLRFQVGHFLELNLFKVLLTRRSEGFQSRLSCREGLLIFLHLDVERRELGVRDTLILLLPRALGFLQGCIRGSEVRLDVSLLRGEAEVGLQHGCTMLRSSRE